jgi:nucleobase:cation symporter-1, NCS1 family
VSTEPETAAAEGRASATNSLPPGASPRLHNEDLAPATERTWGTYSLFAMWMSDVHSLGGYTFAAGLFFLGLVAWQVFVALVLGIAVVFLLMNLTGFAGQRTGAPFPVIARISFGVFGANLPALIRAIIAIAWYGIQTWLASVAMVVLALSIWPGLQPWSEGGFLGLSPLGWAAFAVMWVLQLLVIRRGMETVRRFQDWAGAGDLGRDVRARRLDRHRRRLGVQPQSRRRPALRRSRRRRIPLGARTDGHVLLDALAQLL